jgi:hypothetical protein
MPKQTIEYRCLMISPSDVAQERQALTKMVGQWNAQVSQGLGARIELVRWESHAVPDMSAPPQEVINSQLVDESDLGIAVFWSRLGTPTQEHPSGSIEEIMRLIQRGARVLVYLSERPIPPAQLDPDQFRELQEIRAKFYQEGLLATYSDVNDLCTQANLHLTAIITQLLAKDSGHGTFVPSSGTMTAPTPDVRVTVNAGFRDSPVRPPAFAFFISVQNHSPVPVYINNVYLEAGPGRIVVPNGDYLTGEYQRPRELSPGRSFTLSMDPSELRKFRDGDSLVCAAAADEVGRVYRSSPEELRRALDTLFDYYLGGQ